MKTKWSREAKILVAILLVALLFWVSQYYAVATSVVQWIFRILAPFLVGICIAFVLNVLMRLLEKLWDKLFQKKRGKLLARMKRPLCLVLSIVLVLALIFFVFYLIIPEFIKSISLMVEQFPVFIKEAEAWLQQFMRSDGLQSFLSELNLNWESVQTEITEWLTGNGHLIFSSAWDVTTAVVSGIFNFVLGAVFAVYVLLQKEKLFRQMTRLSNAAIGEKRTEKIRHIAALSNRSFSNFVSGQLLEAVIIGVLCFIGMLIFRMSYAGMISVLVGVTALIPVFGAFFGTAVGAILIFMMSPIKALGFILFIIVLQQLEGDLIYPKVVGDSVGLPGIWVLVAVTIGGSVGGITGMLFSVPVSSVIYSLLKEFTDRRQPEKPDSKENTEDSVEKAIKK